MCKINLQEIISATADLPSAGECTYNKIKDSIEKSEKAILNMTDVIALPSIFLNVSIGKIINEYGKNKMKQYITFEAITKQQANRIKEYVEKF